MAGNKNSGRPGGNPDIVNIKKTGPRTLKGKLATVFAQGTLRADSKSKLLNQIYRSCAKCPLGPQIKKTTVGTKIIEEETRVSYCKHYKAKKSCSISKDEMFFKLKIYYENGEKNFLEDMDRQLAAESFENAQISKMAETLKYGMPGTNTAAHMKLSADIVNNMRKFTEGEKKRIEADITQKVAVMDVGKLLKKKRETKDTFAWEEEDEVKDDSKHE